MESKNTNFSLSFGNMKGIPFHKYEKNFTFIVNNKQYETSRFIADILSPIVRQYHYTDESINSITIECFEQEVTGGQTSSGGNDYFSEFLKLTDFDSKTINETQRKYYIEYFIQLGNIDEYIRLQQETVGDDENADNIIDRLNNLFDRIKHQKNLKMTEDAKMMANLQINKMIKFASSHFSEISKEKIKKLPKEMIERLMDEETLRIDEEDSLLNFIIELYEENDEYSHLFEFVKFENLSQEGLKKFIEIFNIEQINSSIWKSICHRLLPSKQMTTKDEERYINQFNEIHEFEHQANNEFHGIMRYLSDETQGNIHDNGTIEISSNSILNCNENYHPKNVVDYSKNNWYGSNSTVKDATVLFDFKDSVIQLKSYSIESSRNGQNGYHLRSWVVEVSNDKSNWKVVDSHENDSAFQNSSIATFITKDDEEFYRYIRFRQTDKSWANSYDFVFYFVEFYGSLKKKKHKKKAQKKMH
ncbi:hypothetical protein M9Y10_016921 [Tritrichomonas musculus]|uniref:F5/8 type C domain-containing protein n=1 Tax=Tritrichomonas musculus TaxID=1915356 RepID=A0ABR2HXW4_9EUKA